MPNRYILVRWMEEESVGVVPASAASSEPVLGTILAVKYQTKYYDAEILKISANRSALNKDCAALYKGTISREELLSNISSDDDFDAVAVDTTTDKDGTPKKKTKATAKPKETKATAKPKETKATEKETKANGKQAKEKALSERASEILRAKGMARNLFDKEEEYQPPPVKRSALELSQQETIEELKSQLDRLTNASYNFNMSNLQFENCRKVFQVKQECTQDIPAKVSPSSSDPNPFLTPFLTPSRTPSHMPHRPLLAKMPSDVDPDPDLVCLSGETVSANITPSRPSVTNELPKVRLCDGYDVYLTRRQIDEIKSCGGTPTRVFRALLSVFFDPIVLAQSSALGSKFNNGLDRTILEACIGYTQKKFSVARTALVDAANDKCAQARRKYKQQT